MDHRRDHHLGQLIGTHDDTPIHVYTRSDACGAAQTFAAWFDAVQEDLGGTAVYGDHRNIQGRD